MPATVQVETTAGVLPDLPVLQGDQAKNIMDPARSVNESMKEIETFVKPEISGAGEVEVDVGAKVAREACAAGQEEEAEEK